ncbi:MAG: trigger factor [Lachnospiraceae bacterium]|nr:trigger factor [Lachnospiraceae bacterium]
MKRKSIAFLLAAVMTVSLAGCAGKTETPVSGDTAVSNNVTTAVSEDDPTDGEAVSANNEPIEVTESFVEYDIHDCVKLGDYKNMKVTLEDKYEVTEEALISNVNLILTYYAKYEDTDKKVVENGDVANIDYVGKKDGVAFDGGTAQGYDLEIGSGTFIPGFEDGLVGVNVGDTVDLNLTFPENYGNADLAGADVVFTVTVNSIKEKILYTYDTVTDEYVNSIFGYDSKEDLFDAVEAEMKEDNEVNMDTDTRQAVLNELMNSSEVTIPDGLLEQKVEQWIQLFKNQAVRDTDLSTYLKDNYDMTEDEFVNRITEEMSDTLKQELLLEALADDMEFKVSDEEVDDYLNNSVTSSGYESLDEMLFVYSNQFETAKDYLAKNYRYTQALKRLAGNVKVEIAKAGETEETGSEGEEVSENTEENSDKETAEDSGNTEDTEKTEETAE